MLIEVTNSKGPTVVRDSRSQAVLCTDTAARDAHRARRRVDDNYDQRLRNLENQLQEVIDLLKEGTSNNGGSNGKQVFLND
jgi:uncharacterized FlaG/YvyC family protein